MSRHWHDQPKPKEAQVALTIFDPSSWTGRRDDTPMITSEAAALDELRRRVEAQQQGGVAVMERPATKAEKPAIKPPAPTSLPALPSDEPQRRAIMAEYAELAKEIGVAPPELGVDQFKDYLRDSGITVFSLSEVVAYMDDKSKREGQGWGWQWKPLREKDKRSFSFGTSAVRADEFSQGFGIASSGLWDTRISSQQLQQLQQFGMQQARRENRPASDHYGSDVAVYTKTVPLHAIRKVAQISREYHGDVAFFVCDYAPAPAFKADPFLMAVVPNADVRNGVGRFIIDFWDEPGFGVEQMLKSDLP